MEIPAKLMKCGVHTLHYLDPLGRDGTKNCNDNMQQY